MSDLLTTGRFENGKLECRKDMDLALDPTGDLALTPDEETATLQALMFYLFTPKNERPGLPLVGCMLAEIAHDRRTRGVMKRLNASITKDIKTLFPEFKGAQVVCRTVPGSPADIFLTIVLPTGRIMDLVANLDQVMRNSAIMRDIFRW